jgi:hypothetical protein
MHAYLFLLLPVLFLVLQLLLRLSGALFSPLKDIPGPFWTRFTSLWYFSRVHHGQFEHENIKLHQQYGPIVRIAPNQYSISDISAIKTVYGTGSQFAKSAWYDGWKHPQLWTLFSDRDIKRHGISRSIILSSSDIFAHNACRGHSKAIRQFVFHELTGSLRGFRGSLCLPVYRSPQRICRE